jgi:hypothetical protein
VENLVFRGIVVLSMVLILAEPLRARGGVPEKTQWIAVVAPGLSSAIEPLVGHRRAEGFHVVVINSDEVAPQDLEATQRATALRDRVRQRWRAWSGPSTVLLVGAPNVGRLEEPARYVVPPLAGTVARMEGEPSDNGYGCLAGELLPRVAVGRFPARSEAEAEAMVRKTLAWESCTRPGAWKRRFVLLAGAPSYNPMVDKLVEGLTISRFAGLDPAWIGNVIYHNPNSYFTVSTGQLLDQARTYLDEGQLLTVFLGHANVDGFWFEEWRGPYFSSEDWSEIKLPPASGILASIGCWGTHYGGRRGDGHGLYAMRNPDGPVAVIGCYGECWAAMAMLLADGMLKSLPGPNEARRLGDLWLGMKRNLANGPLNPLVFRALDTVDGESGSPEAEQRREHQEMFLLLGDPAVRLPHFADRLDLNCPDEIQAGESFEVSAALPPGFDRATGWVRLERALTSLPAGVEPVAAELVGSERAAFVRANHKRANRFLLHSSPAAISGRRLSAELRLPQPIPWERLIVRVYARSGTDEALGVRSLQVVTPR